MFLFFFSWNIKYTSTYFFFKYNIFRNIIYHGSKKILLAISNLRSERIPRISVKTLWSEAQTIRRRFNHWRERGPAVEGILRAVLTFRTGSSSDCESTLSPQAAKWGSWGNERSKLRGWLVSNTIKGFRFSWKPLLHLFIDACEVYTTWSRSVLVLDWSRRCYDRYRCIQGLHFVDGIQVCMQTTTSLFYISRCSIFYSLFTAGRH